MRGVLIASLVIGAALDAAAGPAVSGRVLGSDGRPLAGATVNAYARERPEDEAERRAAGRPRAPLGVARSGPDGSFRIEAAAQVTWIEARADGRVPLMSAPAPDGPTMITLAKAALRRGVVRGGGRPLGGALVIWTGGSGAELISRTAPDGSFEAPDPEKAPGHLAIHHPEFAVLWAYVAGDGTAGGLDQELVKGTVVEGVVVNAAHRPVPNATLWLDDRIPAGRSDARGVFRIEHAHAEWEYLAARAGGAAGLGPRRAGRVVVKVRPTTSLAGFVRDAATGQPVAGATVVITSAGADATMSADADARGHYAFTALFPGRYRAYAGRSDYVSGPVDYATAEPLDLNSVASARRDFALKALPRVRGRVLDPEGRPIDGAMVALGMKATPHMYLRGAAGPGGNEEATTTGPDGSFTLVLPDPSAAGFNPFGKDRPLVVLKDGYAGAQVEAARLAGTSALAVTLTRGVELAGRVTATDGSPLAAVAVSAAEDGSVGGTMIPTHMVLASAQDEGWTVTDAGGRFALRVHPVVHHLSFRKEGHAPKVVRGHDARSGEAMAVVLDPAAAVLGSVVRADGRGVAGVQVGVTDQSTMTNRSAVTAADGTFTVGDLASGTYQLTASHTELGIHHTQAVDAPAYGVQIVLAPRGTVRGRVFESASRRPVTRFTAVLAPRESGRGGRTVPVEDAQGAFSLDDFPLGTASLTVTADGYATRRIDDVAVTADGEPPEVEVALEPDAALSGRVTGERGAPVAQAVVRPEGDAAGGAPVEASSDEEGEFELRGLAPGEITVRIQANGFLPENRTVDTRQRTRLDVVLRKGLTLRGEVVSDGAGVAGATVGARSSAQGAEDQTTQADERGRFALEGLVPGRYTVSAAATGMGRAETRDVDVEQAGFLRLVLERARTAVLSGKVVGLPAGDEAVIAVVVANGQDGQQGAQAMVDASHTFRMEDAPAGRVEVRAMATSPTASTMRSSRTVELTLAPGSETETVLEFPGDVVISGVVVRNGAPLPGAMVSFAPSAQADMGVFARTDPRGAYEVVGLEAGPHTVRVFGDGVSFSTDYAVAASAEFDIDVTGGTVVGHVVRADGGAPVAGVAIAFFRMDGQPNTPAETATTSAQGAFSQGSLRDGRYRLVTSKAGFGQEVRDVEVARGGTAAVTIELQEAEGVSLTVVDARDGRALEAIVVVRDEARRIVANRHSGVGDDGVLNIPLANGSYILSTSATGYGTATLRVSAPSRGLRVALTPGGTLRVESQRDLRGRLRLVQADGEEYVRCWCNGIADIELGGRVTVVENVTPGAYTVHLPEGMSAAKPVVIREGQVSTITVD